MICRKCEKRGDVLVRVNEKGVTGIWECSPCCGVPFIDQEAALVYALDLPEGMNHEQQSGETK